MQNQSTHNECPVCHRPINGQVCDNCGWAIIDYPAVVPDEIAEFERRRLAAATQVAAGAGKWRDEAGRLNRRVESLSGQVEILTAQLDGARRSVSEAEQRAAEAAAQKPKAFLLFRNPDDADDISVLAVAPGENRYVNRTVASGLPDPLPASTQLIRGGGAAHIDFVITEREGRFYITDSASTLIVDGSPVLKARPVVNESKFSFRGVKGLEVIMSIPRRRR